MPANKTQIISTEVILDDSNLSSGPESAQVSDEEFLPSIKSNLNSYYQNKLTMDYKENNLEFQKTWKYASLPVQKYHENFIRSCVDVILKFAVFEATNRKNKVLEWHSPQELEEIFNFKLKNEPVDDNKMIDKICDVIKYSVKTGHPYFINQLFSSVDPYALIGQWLSDALNPSVYTYEVAPVFTLMEEYVLHEMRRIIGFPNDGTGDGIFCPGGSISNGYAISCARFKYMPDIKCRGLFSLSRLIIFTSEDAHYSIEKLASFMGLGISNVYKIKTDMRGKMRIDHLEDEINRAIVEGALPFMVSATSGTTILGAFDPLEKIHEVCKKFNLWMHVDAAWGGGALMSKKYRFLLKGIEKADSVTWNPHKLLAAPQQCSAFLTPHQNLLSQCHSTNATYLFQKDKFYDTKFDTGDKHIQCGRRADVLKFWFMWQAKGTSGLEEHINRIFHNAEYFTEVIRKNKAFELVLESPECTNVCFWYIPPSLQNSKKDKDFNQKLHTIAPIIKERMMKNGTMMITYQPLRNIPNFFRLVLQNSALEKTDMQYFADTIEQLGIDL